MVPRQRRKGNQHKHELNTNTNSPLSELCLQFSQSSPGEISFLPVHAGQFGNSLWSGRSWNHHLPFPGRLSYPLEMLPRAQAFSSTCSRVHLINKQEISWREGTAERTRLTPGFAGPAQPEKTWIKLEEKLSKQCPAGLDFQMLTWETPYVNSIPPPPPRGTNWAASAKPPTAETAWTSRCQQFLLISALPRFQTAAPADQTALQTLFCFFHRKV